MSPPGHFARKFSILTLTSVFLVILAGSIVRSTGAGMGCPDWPKCFGYLIPPTDESVLLYSAGRNFERGQMVIHNDTLWSATENLTASSTFKRTQWSKYEKHNYAIFNAAHTWTEYVNRLFGALSGLFALVLVFVSALLFVRRVNRSLLWPSLAAMFMIGFTAWLGKVVVDKNLEAGTVSLHMLCSMLIVFFLLLCIRNASRSKRTVVSKRFAGTAAVILVLMLVQIFMGISVREIVDGLLENETTRHGLMESVISYNNFLIHRSYSMLVLAAGILLFVQSRKGKFFSKSTSLIAALLFLEIVAGIALSYFGLPAFMQPVHLFLAISIFSVLANMLVRMRIAR